MKYIGTLYLSTGLINKMQVTPQATIKIRAGNKMVLTRLQIKKNSKNRFMLSPALANALHIKSRRRLKIRYDARENYIHLGPTIGILSTYLPNKSEFDDNSVQAELIFLSNQGKRLPGQIFIFTPGSINWQNGTVRGYNYHQISENRGIWVSSLYPIPEVVYDRIASRSSEARRLIKSTKTKLSNLPYMHYFNPSFLNKWKVYQYLITNSQLHRFIPETYDLNLENLSKMLEKYKTVYLKPSNGSLGRGIIKVTRSKKGGLNYTIYRGGKIKSHAETPQQLLNKTRAFRNKRTYIIQQGLELAKYKGAPFDIRIIYQKNGKGEWQISKKFVRVAPRGSSISNLSSGGRAERSKIVFSYLYRNKEIIENNNKKILELCKMVADTLEKASNKNFGELGLDIGVDKNGEPWLIEANSKPRKTTETQFSSAIVRNTFLRPLQYAIYLAGF